MNFKEFLEVLPERANIVKGVPSNFRVEYKDRRFKLVKAKLDDLVQYEEDRDSLIIDSMDIIIKPKPSEELREFWLLFEFKLGFNKLIFAGTLGECLKYIVGDEHGISKI